MKFQTILLVATSLGFLDCAYAGDKFTGKGMDHRISRRNEKDDYKKKVGGSTFYSGSSSGGYSNGDDYKKKVGGSTFYSGSSSGGYGSVGNSRFYNKRGEEEIDNHMASLDEFSDYDSEYIPEEFDNIQQD